jgi:hypothetical protein
MNKKSEIDSQYGQASIATANNLRTVAKTIMANDLSRLTLSELDEAVDIVSEMVPAGNVPGVILNGLARISGRRPPVQTMKRDINLLFRGVSQVLDQAVYGALFAGPAAVIWGYQNLLKIAGKSLEDAFPEGTWQFYVDYALREDTARHTHETYGFDTLLNQHRIRLSKIDRITAWVMTSVYTLQQYNTLLENEWRERIHSRVLHDIMKESPDAPHYAKLYAQWERQRPYGRRADAGSDTYPVYRRRIFDEFLGAYLGQLTGAQKHEWEQRVNALTSKTLSAYQQQMTIISYLEAGDYGETRTPYPLEQAHIGLIHEGAYYLIPVMKNSNTLTDIITIRSQVASILRNEIQASPANLTRLANLKRAGMVSVLKGFGDVEQSSLQALRYAPILLNADLQDGTLPLSQIRQAERGIGDHALTIFDTDKTFVFDQSHIYFDGAWGASLAEIMTNESLSWAQYLTTLPDQQSNAQGIRSLQFAWTPSDILQISNLPSVTQEIGAESDEVNIKGVLSLRKIFKQRSDLLQLTVNDVMVLYRAIHAITYRPSEELVTHLKTFEQDPDKQDAITKALEAIEDRDNPAILIPVDASSYSPSDRLYPMCFEVPLYDLNLLEIHDQTLQALNDYQNASGDRTEIYQEFDQLQRQYLSTLAGFGTVLSKAKEIATAGESASVGSIKLLAHMPQALQRLLDTIPSRVDMLNDIIKGKEVFSNVGAVAPTSTLNRFITAKDDNDKKTLAWGVITDANGTLRISLRDFRPHVALLIQSGETQLAQQITQDYLDAYTMGLNQYIRELRQITLASRETRAAMEKDQ